MKRKSISALVALVMGGAFALSAQAQTSAASGAYLGGTIGQSKTKDLDCRGFNPCKDSGNAFRVFAGYQINRNLAAEVGYTDLGKFSRRNATSSFDDKITAWEGAALIAYPVADRVAIYGKLGGYYAKVREDDQIGGNQISKNNGGFTFGAGLQVDLTRNFTLRGDWQRYLNVGGSQVPKTDIDAFTFGVLFKFR
jgi:OOP family OmpA-OmpF porin